MESKGILLDLKDFFKAGADVVGNKAYNLALLRYSVGVENVPKCLVLTVDAGTSLDLNLEAVVVEVINKFSLPIIARSSTTVEDSAVSFAGQFVSEVCDTTDELKEAILKVINSPRNDNVIEYCKKKSVNHKNIKVAVLFQPYLSPELSGVMFTKNPINNAHEIIIEYIEGTSDAVTSGSASPQRMIIDSATRELQWPFCELVRIGQQAETFFRVTVDIEWIVSDGKLWIVQVRQITT